ncbi:hypothetical protein [Streptomyces goshikiensis]
MTAPVPPADSDDALARAEEHLQTRQGAVPGIAWALVAIARELATIRRDLRKRR